MRTELLPVSLIQFMAGVRSLSVLAHVPPLVVAASTAGASTIAASSPSSLQSERGGTISGGLSLRHRSSRGLLGRAGRASLVMVLASSANSAMVVTEERSGNAAVADEENIATETEFMVKMSCEGCVKSVRDKLLPLEGVKSVDVDLANQVVRILGSASIRSLTSAIEQTGRDARLVGQGLSSTVAEFKGPEINGVVRFAQVRMDLARIDASFSGLTPGSRAWSINTYGDLTQGAASTGGIFELESPQSTGSKIKPLGDLGTLDVNSSGETDYSGTKAGLQVSDLIGRSVVLYENEDKSKNGITAAVIARSAGVGENYKKLCSCDGTVIWESTNNDFVEL